ncbi:MAG: S41 family peptidase [Nitrospinae bacterium]|nr:S41 family peptidase [Nitrospinota bacterium]
MLNKRLRRLSTWVAAGVLGALLFSLSWTLQPGSDFTTRAYAGFFNDDLEIFEQVMDLIADKYWYPPNFKKMFSAAIKEMAARTGKGTVTHEPADNLYTFRRGDGRIQVRINFSRDDNMETLKEVFYFLADQPEVKYTKYDLEVAAINGAMSTLDSYSLFLDKDQFSKSMDDTEGKYGGLGMVITIKDNKLVVVKTMKNAPAERAGILPKDIITKVDGKIIKGMQVGELADKLRGHPNTKVTLTVYRPGIQKEFTYKLTREIIAVETVEFKMLKDRAAYLKITSFSRQTNEQFEEALRKAQQDTAKAFILDFRENPGGLLDQSIKIAGHFLKKGALVVYTQGRTKKDYMEYRASYKNGLIKPPLVILIDRYSASASEIVAGSLKDLGRAIIAGQNSYGKGSVQTIFKIGNDQGLRLTTSKYFTPSGVDITKHGIIPEIMIIPDLPGEGEDAPEGEKASLKSSSARSRSVVTLKKSELENYIKERGMTVEEGIDPLILFAQLIIKNTSVANKSHTLAKARELAKDIHY